MSSRPYKQQSGIENLHRTICVVIFNSLPRENYGTIVQQLPAGIETLTMPQVTACLQLEAASMATDKARFKDVIPHF